MHTERGLATESYASPGADDAVDVIVPCFNQGRFLAAAIDSLQSQSHLRWRALIIDDGSTDDTPAIGRNLALGDARVEYWRKDNGGPSSARNFGLQRAGAPLVQFLDADDLLAPDKLAAHVEHLLSHPEVGVVYGNATYFEDADPSRTSRDGLTSDPVRAAVDWIGRAAADPRPFLHKALASNPLAVPCAVVRRAAIVAAGGFDESLLTMEDWDLWIRLTLAGVQFRYLHVSNTDALVRVHPVSASRHRPRMRDGAYRLAALDLARIDDEALRLTVLQRVAGTCRRDGGGDAKPLLRALRGVLTTGETRALSASLWLQSVPLPYRMVAMLRRVMPMTFGL